MVDTKPSTWTTHLATGVHARLALPFANHALVESVSHLNKKSLHEFSERFLIFYDIHPWNGCPLPMALFSQLSNNNWLIWTFLAWNCWPLHHKLLIHFLQIKCYESSYTKRQILIDWQDKSSIGFVIIVWSRRTCTNLMVDQVIFFQSHYRTRVLLLTL